MTQRIALRAKALAVAAAAAAAPAAGADIQSIWWDKFPAPSTVVVSIDTNSMPGLEGSPAGAPTVRGEFGAHHLMLASLAGLSAAAVRDGRGDEMLAVGHDNPALVWVRQATARAAGSREVLVEDPWECVERFREQGIVDGFILCRVERSPRPHYVERREGDPPLDRSTHIALSLAGVLDAIVVDESLRAEAEERGLRMLFDARKADPAEVFEEFKDRLNPRFVMLTETRSFHAVEYAVATRAWVYAGVDDLSERVLEWSKPGYPLIGWNTGDEFHHTAQATRHGRFNSATNWSMNIAQASTARVGGEAIPWESVSHPGCLASDLAGIRLGDAAHHHAFLMSDGDNVQWLMGNFTRTDFGRNYWDNPRRGSFPMGWTACTADLLQLAPVVLQDLRQSATANDDLVLYGGGYYYADLMLEEAGEQALRRHVDATARLMEAMNARTLGLLLADWDSEHARAAYQVFADRIPQLNGIVAVDYSPYNAGLGETIWITSVRGDEVPVSSARYALWADLPLPLNGGPAETAALINERAADAGRPAEERIDWTIVHAWSTFDHPDGAEPPAIGLSPVAWTADALDDGIAVVTPTEMLLRMRLQRQPGLLIDRAAEQLLARSSNPAQRRAIAEARARAAALGASPAEDAVNAALEALEGALALLDK